MSFSVVALFSAVENSNFPGLWSQFQKMSEEEIVAAGTAIGPDRLRELLYRFVRQSRALPTPFTPFGPRSGLPMSSPSAADPVLVIPAVLSVAFKDHLFLGLENSQSQLAAIRLLLNTIHGRRAAAPQVVLYRDVTRTLPSPTACPAPLSDANFADVATRQNITVASIKAVAQVESGGRSGFDEQYRPKILFEAHHFRKHTKRLFDLSHPHLSCERASAKKYYRWDQYSRLYEAMVLNPVAVIKSASWGKFQVLGSNHNGWPDPTSFARAMQESENNHLKSFEAYCVTNGLIVHLRNKDWARFAEGYNGKNYKDFDYDTKIANAYKKYGGT